MKESRPRKRLPHWVPDGVPVFVTWRLAGTLPVRSDRNGSSGQQFVAQDRELDKAASGPTWLADSRVARMVVDALQYGESERNLYVLHAFVIMPNHVHVVWEPKAPMPSILRWLKHTTAYRARQILPLNSNAFWQKESYDHWVRSGEQLRKIIRYVEWNPVKAGFVATPEEWDWSSATQTARPSAPLAADGCGGWDYGLSGGYGW